MGGQQMTRRAGYWVLALGLLDLLVFALTLHAHTTYRRTATGPSVMPVGQLLGWAASAVLFALVILVILGARRAARDRDWR